MTLKTLFTRRGTTAEANRISIFRSIRFKLLLTILSLIIVLLITFTAIQIVLQKNTAHENLQSRINLMKQNLVQQGKSFSKLLVVQVENDIAAFNFSQINVYLENTIQEWENLRYAILTDLEGTAYIHTENPDLQQTTLTTAQDQFAIKQQKAMFKEYPDKHIIEYITPIKFGKPWGVLRLGIGLEDLENEIVRSTEELNIRTHEILTNSVIIAIIFIVFSSFVVMIFSTTISKPIIRLAKFSQQLGKGNFNKAIKAYQRSSQIDTRTEIGLLATSFIEMAEEIQKNQLELEDYSRTLEDKVQQRTEELLQSEKMAALGQLIAGIAHEINTPLGAIGSCAHNMQTLLEYALPLMPDLFQNLSKQECGEFIQILNRSLASSASLLSAKEQRQKRKSLMQQLDDKVPEEDIPDIADTLTDMGIYDEIDSVISLLKKDNGYQIFDLAYKLSELNKGTQTIYMATERASKIVFALKSYAHEDRSGDKIQANVLEGLENILTLYQSQMKQGVTLIKKYAENIPRIYCYPDELNQVWTNLIHNALQAMNNQGILSIAVEQAEDNLKVSVLDNGTGISPEHISKIFDPFFTTKSAGEGSGLGLHIIKKIIDKHKGKISVESVPGRTLFSVFLPIMPEN